MSDRHEHLDEGMIHAWLDGALSPDESARIESQAAACEECSARVAEARGLIAASSRILSSLDAVPAGVIPGSSSGSDQLAALRVRGQAAGRRWWQDRRMVVAASLMLVVGVSRVAWQFRSESGAETVGALMDSAQRTEPVVSASAPPAVAAPSPAPAMESARELKAQAPVEASTRVARATDSSPPPKVADASSSLAQRAAVANEARRTDSIAVTGVARADSTVVAQAPPARLEIQQQQGLGGAARQAQTFGADSTRRFAAAPARPLNSQRGIGAAAPAASRADAVMPVSCYLLRTASTVDTVRLFNQPVPVSSDPAWFRAVATGALRDSTLAWRFLDSVTVELRRGSGADSVAVRMVTSSRVNCP